MVVLQFWPSWTLIPVVLAIFVAGQGVADYMLAPFLVAERIHLNPVEVMFAIAAFGYLLIRARRALLSVSPRRS